MLGVVVDVRDEGRLFSSATMADVPSSGLLDGLRVEEVAPARVGGLLVVLPEARDESVLAWAVDGDVVVREVAGGREEEEDVAGFFGSLAFAGAFALVAVRLSMLLNGHVTVAGWILMDLELNMLVKCNAMQCFQCVCVFVLLKTESSAGQRGSVYIYARAALGINDRQR